MHYFYIMTCVTHMYRRLQHVNVLYRKQYSERKSNNACSFRLGSDMTVVYKPNGYDYCVSIDTSLFWLVAQLSFVVSFKETCI